MTQTHGGQSRYTVRRGFLARGESYKRGDAFMVDTLQKRADLEMLLRHGLIAPDTDEGGNGGVSDGGERGKVPPIRGI